MPEFWQFPTVSMGLGPIMAIYQARFLKYLHARGLADTENRHVWVFCGDGEMDEPESLGAISLAGREKLDNLIFVINCNLQRLDGLVRGNGKIIQELEGGFAALAERHQGGGPELGRVAGEGHERAAAPAHHGGMRRRRIRWDFKSKSGALHPREVLRAVSGDRGDIADWSDERIWKPDARRYDPSKVHAAYKAAVVERQGRPTVILAKTVKGYGMGEAGEGQMITHQQKKMGLDALRQFRDRSAIPASRTRRSRSSFVRFEEGSAELRYLRARREALGGYLPTRRVRSDVALTVPLSAFEAQLKATDGREISTTMAFVRILNTLLRDKNLGKRVVPIVPDESRTFGMEGMFRQFGI